VAKFNSLHTVGWLEFSVPFQHKYGHISDDIIAQSHTVTEQCVMMTDIAEHLPYADILSCTFSTAPAQAADALLHKTTRTNHSWYKLRWCAHYGQLLEIATAQWLKCCTHLCSMPLAPVEIYKSTILVYPLKLQPYGGIVQSWRAWNTKIFNSNQTKHVVIMVALCNRADHYIFILWFLLLLSFFLLFFLA